MTEISKEAIEAIENLFPRYAMQKVAAIEALSNPEIYEKAGLISLEDAMGFAEWVGKSEYILNTDVNEWYDFIDGNDAGLTTTAQLFQIYQELK